MQELESEGAELQAIMLELGEIAWHIGNIYVGNNSANSEERWSFLKELEAIGKHGLTLLGDFNARHTGWGNLEENTQGKVLENMLTVLNDNNKQLGNHTTGRTRR